MRGWERRWRGGGWDDGGRRRRALLLLLGGGLEGLKVMAAEVGGWSRGFVLSERLRARDVQLDKCCDGRHSVSTFSGLERSDLARGDRICFVIANDYYSKL